MNERIKQLWDKANLQWKGEFDQASEPRECRTVRDIFAELIIKECATVQHKRFCEHGDVSWDILMEHFGIKE